MDSFGIFHNFWTDCSISSLLTYRLYYRRVYNLQTMVPLLPSSRLNSLILSSTWTHLSPHQLRARCRKYVLMLNTAFLVSELFLQAVKYKLLAGAVILKRSGFEGEQGINQKALVEKGDLLYEVNPTEQAFINHNMQERGGIISIVGFSRSKDQQNAGSTSVGDIGSFQPLIVLSDERQDDV